MYVNSISTFYYLTSTLEENTIYRIAVKVLPSCTNSFKFLFLSSKYQYLPFEFPHQALIPSIKLSTC